MFRHIKFGIYLVVGITIASELFARSFGFGHPLLYQPSPAGYEFKISQSIHRFGHTTNINALGTRGPSASLRPNPNSIRLLSLGDSVANGGTQIDDYETYPLQLQIALSQFNKKIEVLNAAVGGWSVLNEAAWLHEHGTLGASAIILEINEKDLDQTFAPSEILDKNTSFPSHNPTSALFELITRYVLPRLHIGPTSADPGSEDGTFNPRQTPAVINAVDDSKAISTKANAQLFVMYWDAKQPAQSQVILARNQLLEHLKNIQVTVIRPELNDSKGGDLFYRDSIHPNSKANTVIANKLAAVIERELRQHPYPNQQ